ncbi:uncharacterized protein LOC128963614 [Oppia nitens]|uniref:uncharacterized protein LOC128963614 n=1 Tax=Oppia nitens TaxID=1686743 RepID=UPI0023DAA6E5|nr:uncharacterized protein LOC128963614 [Oppia nitens]
MRGICNDAELTSVNCSAKSDSIALTENQTNVRLLTLLKTMCPHLYEAKEAVCCDEFQLESMFITVYNLAHLGFNHCPSCLKNLEKLFCQMNCSPKQNQFISVTKNKQTNSGDDFRDQIDYYITDLSAQELFDSCKYVNNFEGRVVDSTCGGLKGDDCKASDWLNFLGNSIEVSGVSPFKINFHLTNQKIITLDNKSFEPLNQTFVKCSEKATKDLEACDCHNCHQSCSGNALKRDVSFERSKRDTEKCLMKGICGETAFGAIPCVVDEEPTSISNPIALEELKEMCPHLATSDSPSVCCSEQQVIRLNQTFEMLSMFLKECPTCVRNFEKIICHLSCGRDQHNFMKVTETKTNEDGKQMVSEVQYFVNDDWVKGIYDSCKEVHRLGFNVLDHYCKPFKAVDCNHQRFLQFIGGNAEHFGHSPFEINFIFTNDDSVVSDGVTYIPAKQPFYKCWDKLHTNEDVCPCIHCQESCKAGEVREIKKQLPKAISKTKRSTNYQQNNIFNNYLETIVYNLTDYHLYLNDDKDDNDNWSKADHLLTCCQPSYIRYMHSIFKAMDKLGFGECPSCMHNLRQIVCQFSCSPKQNRMIRVLDTTKLDSIDVIDHLELYVDSNFAQTLYDSCKSLFNGTLINSVCGKWGHINKCSVRKWFDFIGLSYKKGGYSPFQLDIKMTKTNNIIIDNYVYQPINQTVFECNESPIIGTKSCSCHHCPQAYLQSIREMNETFESLGLSNWLLKSLKRLGIENPSTIQSAAIPLILSPKRLDVFGCSRTGSGKTLAFLLPIIELLVRDPRPYFALILSPTRELAHQINQMILALTASTYAVKSLLVIGGEDHEEIQGLWFGKPNIVVATPGRLVDQFYNRNFLDVCGQKTSIRFDCLVLDEADQLISSGFAQQIKDILSFMDGMSAKVNHKRQTLLFSASLTTALEELQKLIAKKSTDEKPVVINLLPTIDDVKRELATNEELDQRYILCPESVKFVYLIECILDLLFRQMIIFCSTKKEAKLIHKVLISLGFDGPDFNLNPVILNADMKQHLRFAAFEKFRSLKSRILVTTDIANRGLDLPQVDLIINYNCPKSATVYVHRVGRTCRKPDFKPVANSRQLLDEIDETYDTKKDEKRYKKYKREGTNQLKPKKTQTQLATKYSGKSVTFVTQYDIDLFKSIESFIETKMKVQEIDEKSVLSIMKQVSVAIKDAEIRLEHEEQESQHIENKNRFKKHKNKKLKI